jgi:hypothetical protein
LPKTTPYSPKYPEIIWVEEELLKPKFSSSGYFGEYGVVFGKLLGN